MAKTHIEIRQDDARRALSETAVKVRRALALASDPDDVQRLMAGALAAKLLERAVAQMMECLDAGLSVEEVKAVYDGGK